MMSSSALDCNNVQHTEKSQTAKRSKLLLRFAANGVSRTTKDLGAIYRIRSQLEQCGSLLFFELKTCCRSPVNLIWAISKAQPPGSSETAEEGRVLAEPHRAMCLDAAIHEDLHLHWDVSLHKREELAGVGVLVASLVHQICSLFDQEAACLDFHTGLGDILQDGVEPCQLPPEGLSLLHPLAHKAECSLSLPKEAHAVVDTPRTEATLADLEAPPFAQQNIGERHPDVFEENFHVSLWCVILAKGLHGA